MNIFKFGADFIGDVGFGIIKNSAKMIYGGGEAIVGMVTEDNELVESGVKKLGGGAVGLGSVVIKKAINGDESENENEDIDVDSM